MTNNSIKTLPNKVFEENKNLEDIDLSHNQLEKWPRNGKNPLEYLKALNLSFNQLTEIDENSMILNMLNLESIDLSHNLLNGTFVPWMINFRVKRVDLSHNHIAGINVSMEWWNEAFKAHKAYKNFQANFTLNLAGNPLKCDCWMTELKLNLERRPMVMEGKKEENPLDKMFHLVDDEVRHSWLHFIPHSKLPIHGILKSNCYNTSISNRVCFLVLSWGSTGPYTP